MQRKNTSSTRHPHQKRNPSTFTHEDVMQNIDPLLRKNGIIRGMNEQTIQTVRQAARDVIHYMKINLNEGMENKEAYVKAIRQILHNHSH